MNVASTHRAAPAFTAVGSGRPLVFLHGGPGDTAGYLQSLVPLLSDFRCILYNQAGSGILPPETPADLSVMLLVAELESLRVALGLERLTLVGHSWGAELALFYAATYPTHVERLILVGTGPLSEEAKAVAHANLIHPLTVYERDALETIRVLRLEALEAGEWETYGEITLELVTQFYCKAWFFDQAAALRFAALYRQDYGFNPFAARRILESADHPWLWSRMNLIVAPTLIVYGYQDFEPITQAFALKQALPDAQIALLNGCGHVPWLEQPDAVLSVIRGFLE